MSEKPHTVAIGAFVMGTLLIAITTVIFVLGSGLGADRSKVVMVFEGSVKGLSVGAPVALRGVQIGQVTDIELILDSETVELIMLVEAEFSDDNVRRRGSSTADLTEELIQRGLRAQLNTQSLLTGLLYIQLDFHPDSAINLANIDSPHLQIPTIPTELERITRELDQVDFAAIASNLEATAEGLNSFVSSEGFQALPAELRQTLQSVNRLSDQLQVQLSSSGPRLDRVLDGAAVTVETANEELPRLATLVSANMEALENATIAFEAGMREIDGLVAPDSRTVYQLNQALQELAKAGRALQLLARTLEEQPEALIRGKSGGQ